MPEEQKPDLNQPEEISKAVKPEKVESIPEVIPEIKPEAEPIPEMTPQETKGEMPVTIPAPSLAPADQTTKEEIKNIKDLNKEKQVQALSRLAFSQGISYAISVARGLNNAYVLDALHDYLIDQLYEELIKKGKLKEL